jgi:NodT family efflux transporter outer membrane factor (OMF) lipoprotein
MAGCTVGPDFRRPGAELPTDWPSAAELDEQELLPQGVVASSDQNELATWWQVFDDETLNTLIAEATSQSIDLRQASLRILESRAQRGTVRSDKLPSFEYDASFRHQKTSTSGGFFGQINSGGGPGLSIDTTNDQWSMGIDGSWEVDVFGRIERLIEAADGDLEASVWDYRDINIILLGDIASNYIDVRAFQKRIQIAERNLVAQRRSLEISSKRFDAGLTNELDVAQARANALTTEAEIPNLRVGYRQAVNRLSVLMGRPPGYVDNLLEETSPIPKPERQIAIGIPADLLRRRPDIRRAEWQLAAQNARVGAAIAELYPQFSIAGSFGADAQQASHWFTPASLGANIGPAMRWNVLNFGKLRNNVQLQHFRNGQNLAAYESTVLRAAEEVDNALMSYTREQQRLGILQDAVAASDRAVELARKQYTQGTATFQRVLDSQRSLLQTEDQVALSQANASKDIVALYRALGGGWVLPLDEIVGEEGKVGDVFGGDILVDEGELLEQDLFFEEIELLELGEESPNPPE